MARLAVVAALMLFVIAPASAGVLEDASGGQAAYQADAGTDHDAPDTCEDALAAPEPFDLPADGSVEGLIVAAEDEQDHYRVAIGQELVGGRVSIYVVSRSGSLPFGSDVFVPGCGSSVSAPENQPETADHPAPSAGERQVSADVTVPAPVEPCVDRDADADTHSNHRHQDKRGVGHYKDRDGDDCAGFVDPCANPWSFELTGFTAGSAPLTVHAVWTDGSEQNVALTSVSGNVTTYHTGDHLDVTLHSVTANVPEAWNGTFRVTRFSCDAQDGGAVFGEQSYSSERSVVFTPTEAGTYVLAVRRVDATVPTSMTMSCHTICASLPESANEFAGYEGFFDPNLSA